MQPANTSHKSHSTLALYLRDRRDDELAAAFQNFLRAVKDTLGARSDENDDPEQSLTFEVCVNDHLYYVCIEQSSPLTDAPGRPLSFREQEIARLISRGMSNKAIASALRLSPCTVSTYIKCLYLKLNVNSRTEMVVKVLSERALHSPGVPMPKIS